MVPAEKQIDPRGRMLGSARAAVIMRESSGGADRARLAEWERAAFTALRRHRDAATLFDDVLPADPLLDGEATRLALAFLAIVG